jgi:hypothetical protein
VKNQVANAACGFEQRIAGHHLILNINHIDTGAVKLEPRPKNDFVLIIRRLYGV